MFFLLLTDIRIEGMGIYAAEKYQYTEIELHG